MDDTRASQASAIEALYRTEGDRLWWALLGYTGDPELANDAAAEAFARALQARDTIRDPAAWVWKVGFRVAANELRSRSRPYKGSDASYEIDERAVEVMSALAKLSRSQRAAVVLFYFEGLSTKEIANVMGSATATVSVHLHRARRRLRAILGDNDA